MASAYRYIAALACWAAARAVDAGCARESLYSAVAVLATADTTPRHGIASQELARLVALSATDAVTAAADMLTLLSAQDPVTGMMPSQLYASCDNATTPAVFPPPGWWNATTLPGEDVVTVTRAPCTPWTVTSR